MEKILYNAMLTSIQKELIRYKEDLEKLQQIDYKHCKINPEIDKFFQIIENYKKKNIENKNKKLTIAYNGNPYITLNLSIIAIIYNISIKLNIDNNMLGVNKFIIKIINDKIKDNKLNIKLELTADFDGENLIFIDRINDFNIIKNKKENIKFIPYESIDIYCDEDDLEDLYEKIYDYAINMNIDVDIFDEETIEIMLKYGKGAKKVILSNQEGIKDCYKGKNIYVNENPFKDESYIFNIELINNIIS